MNYIEYTIETIENNMTPDELALIVGAGFNAKSERMGYIGIQLSNILVNDGTTPIEEWCDAYKNRDDFVPVDLVFMCRVLEHFPIRPLDYYLYQIYTIMNRGGRLICVTPDMPAVANLIETELRKEAPDSFKIKRLNFEMFNEGPHIFDRHALWASEKSLRYFLEREKLFRVESTRRVGMDSELAPDQIEVVAVRR